MGSQYYNDAAFRALFPAYANTGTYPQATIQAQWNVATAYINNCGWSALNPAQLALALNQLTAHLLYINGIIASGNIPTMVNGASIDKISVTLQPPPFGTSEFKWWLGLSPYGQQLVALLSIVGMGGYYGSTALPGRAGFRCF